jgi:prepilin-type N-terminal cleavage/methylation domain-containing protein
MLARIQKAMKEKDEGFTLIELLVVIIIIGILAAIAIPVFLNQRKKATESSMKSDLRTVANEMETYFTDFQVYPTVTGSAGTATVGTTPVKVSSGNTVTSTTSGAATGTFCLTVTNPQIGTDAAATISYDSDKGGLLPKGTACS